MSGDIYLPPAWDGCNYARVAGRWEVTSGNRGTWDLLMLVASRIRPVLKSRGIKGKDAEELIRAIMAGSAALHLDVVQRSTR